MQAKITKGQVTGPKAIRERLHLRQGHRLEFLIEADGRVRITPVTTYVIALKGMFSAAETAIEPERNR